MLILTQSGWIRKKNLAIPVGKVDFKTLYPMDLEEFMLALGEQALVEQIKKFKALHGCL